MGAALKGKEEAAVEVVVGKLARKSKAELAGMVDECLRIAGEEAEIAAQIAKKTKALRERAAELSQKRSALEAEIKGGLSVGLDPLKGNEVAGALGVAKVGKCKMRTEVVDKAKLRDLLEKAQKGSFFELATISLGDARKYLTDKQLEAVLEEHHDGARSFKIEAKA